MKKLMPMVVLPLLAIAGCLFGPDSVVVLKTDKTSYALGDTLKVTVTNLSDETLEYGFCGWELERWDFDTEQWKEFVPLAVQCLSILAELRSGRSFDFKYVYPPSIPAHSRYRVSFSGFEESQVPPGEAVSNEFGFTR